MNFLLLSASICASKSVEQKTVLPAEETVTVIPSEETIPVEEIETGAPVEEFNEVPDNFRFMGPVNGVCSSQFNSHPLVIKNVVSQDVLGKWTTVLADVEILDKMFVPLCMTAEFKQLDGQEEIIYRLGELNSLKDDVTGKEVFAFSGQSMTLLFDNLDVPTIANQYSFSPSNKFTQFLDLGIEDTLVTMTCVQLRSIAPPQMIREMEKQALFSEMRGNIESAENIRMEIEDLSAGQMVNMYEVHVKDLSKYGTPELKEQLRIDVSEKLGLGIDEAGVEGLIDDADSADRLRVVMQDPEVCALSREL